MQPPIPSRQQWRPQHRRAALCAWLVLACACWGSGKLLLGAAQETVPADATPSIASVQPSSAQAGARVTLTIDGERFAEGAYVSFSDPAIHVLATRRLSDKRLEVDVAIGGMAPPETIRLFVANPAGTSGESSFAIAAGAPAAAQPQASTPTATQSAASAPAAPAAKEPTTEGSEAPIVSKIDPAQAAVGSKVIIKVSGKKFVKGAKVAFQNPGIRVLGTEYKKSSQLVVQIEVASNAATGATRLYVINPDDSEVEAGFEVTATNSTSSSTSGQSASKGSAAKVASQTFSVISLGDAISILQNPGKPRGTLVLADGKLTYQEAGKDVFVAGPGDVKEVAPNILFGFNTSTFHIILNSGKTYNFVAGSLAPADTSAMVTALQKAFQ